jgi:hypothetical protein
MGWGGGATCAVSVIDFMYARRMNQCAGSWGVCELIVRVRGPMRPLFIAELCHGWEGVGGWGRVFWIGGQGVLVGCMVLQGSRSFVLL